MSENALDDFDFGQLARERAEQLAPKPAPDADAEARRDNAFALGRQLDELRAGGDPKLLERADGLYEAAVAGDETSAGALHKLRMAVHALEQRAPEDEQPPLLGEDTPAPPFVGAPGDGDQIDARLAAIGNIAEHCWRGAHWEKPAGQHPSFRREPLKKSHLEKHLDGGNRVGLAPIVPGNNTTRIALLDFDSHKGETGWEEMVAVAKRVRDGLRAHGLDPIAFRSSGGRGIHLMMLWDEPQDAHSVRVLLVACLEECGLKNGTKGVKAGEVEVFPKQSQVPESGCGNMFILFGAGDSALLDTETLKPIEVPPEFQLPKSETVDFVAPNGPPSREPPEYSADLNGLREALSKIHNDAASSLDYDEWRNVIFAIHHATGGSEEGRQLAHVFSARSPKYDEHFLDERVWPYIRDSQEKPITIDTLRYMARSADPTADLDMLDELPPEESKEEAEATEAKPVVSRLHRGDEFIAWVKPSDWIWHEVLERGFVYALTARWGHAKTALMLTLLLHAVIGRELCGHEMKPCRVLYLCGENPEDVRRRVMGAMEVFDVPRERLADVYFTEAPFAIDNPAARKAFLAEATQQGPFGLAVIDTGPAHSAGDDENDNRQAHQLAIAMRALVKPLGNPAVIVLMHPAKDAGKDNLQPRGGGAFSGSIDGEMSAWAEQNIVELFHRAKFRGPGFEPMFYRLMRHELPALVDNFGRSTITVVAVPTEDRPANKRQPKGEHQKVAWRLVNDLSDVGDGTVSRGALIKTVKEHLTDVEPKRRQERARAAVAGLEAAGWIYEKDGAMYVKGVAR